MTDEEIIKLGLIELLIKMQHWDRYQAKFFRKVFGECSKEELLAKIRAWQDLEQRTADLMANMPEDLRAMMDNMSPK